MSSPRPGGQNFRQHLPRILPTKAEGRFASIGGNFETFGRLLRVFFLLFAGRSREENLLQL